MRIPVEFELPGTEAIISRDGDRLILEPVRKAGLIALLDGWQGDCDSPPDIVDPPPNPEDVF